MTPAFRFRRFAVGYALTVGPLREHPGRAVLAVAAIALGVALGVAVHLINASAVSDFGAAARHLAGRADLVVRGPRAGFDESLYPRLARHRGVEAANPGIELDVPLAGRDGTIRVLGFDPLRAAQVQPSLLPERSGMVSDLLEGDTLLLSPEAAQWLGLQTGDILPLTVGTETIVFTIVGILPHDAYRQRLALMDISTAQWRLGRLGRLNRIDLKLAPGVDLARFGDQLDALLPPGVHAATPRDETERSEALSRAYRTNLDMLALVALFTGAFLVYSSQVLALLRRRAQLAMLRAMGVTRASLSVLLVAEAVVIGALGAACGLVLGYFLARYAVAALGADLGAGYFRAITTEIQADPRTLMFFFVLGIAFTVVGTAAPALEAARRPPARGLRAGDAEDTLRHASTARWGVLAMIAAALSALIPPVQGLPIGGYLAIALILVGSVLVMPALAAVCLDRLPAPSNGVQAIAFAQLKGAPRQAAISVAAIVISMSLMVSMLIMVHSFRSSLDAWLERMLPADLYLRAASGGETAFLTPAAQSRIAETPGVARADFLRSQNLLLDAARVPLTLIARTVDAQRPERSLPMVGPALIPGSGDPPPVWVSEVASDLYGFMLGHRVRLPIGGEVQVFLIAGIWRDYARQNGAIVIERERYVALTGDRLANDAALWLAPGVRPGDVQSRIRARMGASDRVEISTPREVRAASLAIFDRTFAITYALEAAAIVVGLLGISLSFSAQTLARRREFGVLRHLGMTRSEIAAALGIEGALVTALGVAFGIGVGWLISLILVHVINRQSFHWTMETDMPWVSVATLAFVVLCSATLTAVWSGRPATRGEAVQAVREDW